MARPLTIELPDSLRDFIDRRIGQGEFVDVHEYFISLIHQDQLKAERLEIEQELRTGIESGEPIPVNADYWRAKLKKY